MKRCSGSSRVTSGRGRQRRPQACRLAYVRLARSVKRRVSCPSTAPRDRFLRSMNKTAATRALLPAGSVGQARWQAAASGALASGRVRRPGLGIGGTSVRRCAGCATSGTVLVRRPRLVRVKPARSAGQAPRCSLTVECRLPGRPASWLQALPRRWRGSPRISVRAFATSDCGATGPFVSWHGVQESPPLACMPWKAAGERRSRPTPGWDTRSDCGLRSISPTGAGAPGRLLRKWTWSTPRWANSRRPTLEPSASRWRSTSHISTTSSRDGRTSSPGPASIGPYFTSRIARDSSISRKWRAPATPNGRICPVCWPNESACPGASGASPTRSSRCGQPRYSTPSGSTRPPSRRCARIPWSTWSGGGMAILRSGEVPAPSCSSTRSQPDVRANGSASRTPSGPFALGCATMRKRLRA